MIQITLIQIDNYGPWTVTPGPRAEPDLQTLQSRLYGDLEREKGSKLNKKPKTKGKCCF